MAATPGSTPNLHMDFLGKLMVNVEVDLSKETPPEPERIRTRRPVINLRHSMSQGTQHLS